MAKKAASKGSKKTTASDTGRTRQLSKKQLKAKAKKIARAQKPLPGSFRLTKQVFSIWRSFWKPLGGIFLVYLLLNVIFATGLISDLNSTASQIANSHGFSRALSGFGSLLGSGTAASSTGASLAQTLMLVFESLVIIWALRQLLAGEVIKVKQAYYQAMTPLIPFLLIVLVIILELLPVTIGAASLAIVLSSAVVASGLVTFIAYLLLALLASISIFMLSSSVFALYIVTLPDMQPRQALRSAKNLVRYRRWHIIRRLLFLPISVLLLMAIITIPLILVASFSVAVVFFGLSMLSVLYVHTYLYSLYRGLIA